MARTQIAASAVQLGQQCFSCSSDRTPLKVLAIHKRFLKPNFVVLGTEEITVERDDLPPYANLLPGKRFSDQGIEYSWIGANGTTVTLAQHAVVVKGNDTLWCEDGIEEAPSFVRRHTKKRRPQWSGIS